MRDRIYWEWEQAHIDANGDIIHLEHEETLTTGFLYAKPLFGATKIEVSLSRRVGNDDTGETDRDYYPVGSHVFNAGAPAKYVAQVLDALASKPEN